MRNFVSFAGDAFLLCRDGSSISVMNHPSSDFEFESILYILSEYGSDIDKELVSEYEATPNDSLKQLILSVYDNNWCKVREWEGRRLITFRITSTDSFDWYPTILDFLLTHSEYKNSYITVETDKRTGTCKTYWEEVQYESAILPEYERIMATRTNIYL